MIVKPEEAGKYRCHRSIGSNFQNWEFCLGKSCMAWIPVYRNVFATDDNGKSEMNVAEHGRCGLLSAER